MKRSRFSILALLTAALCLTALLVLVWNQPEPAADVFLVTHGIQTNSAGTLCMQVGATNRSNRTYGVGFGSQSKPAGGWTDPSRIQHFNLCTGELQPTSGIEVLVPLPPSPGPWRLAAAYFDKDEMIPSGWLGRYWRSVRMRWNRSHYLKITTTPEVSSKNR